MVYRIKRKADGMYSSGRQHPRFDSKGKWWRSIGAVRNHLAMFKGIFASPNPYTPISDYEIEVSELAVTGYLRMEEELSEG